MYNILICDDDRDIVEALKIYLSGEDYRLFAAYNGQEALEVVRQHEIHCILMDVMMPKMDGITATAALRRESNVPIILLTAKSESSDKVLGLNIGADDYVTKPFDPVEVQARVRSQLRRYTLLGARAGSEESGVYTVGNVSLNEETKRVTVDGETVPLPDVLWLDLYGGTLGETGDYALLYARTADAAEGEDDRQLLLSSDGTVHFLPYGEHFLTGARGYLYSVDYTLVPADTEDPWDEPDRVPSGIRCYEIASGESWLLTAELELYEFVTDGDLFFTCVPWGEEQVAWRLQYDDAGRPVSLTQLSPNVAPEH